MKSEKSILSVQLKTYRKEKGMTQEQLAELLEVSDKSVSKWELDKGYPSKKNVMKISEVLEISLEDLIIEESTKEKRLEKSVKYSMVSYFIIFGFTLFIRGIREKALYSNILSRDLSEIAKIIFTEIGQNVFIAIVPAIIIGLVFYFYLIPVQKNK